jgi:hypothetical protein
MVHAFTTPSNALLINPLKMLWLVLYIFHSFLYMCTKIAPPHKHFLIGDEEIIAVTKVLQYLKTPDQIGK